MGQDKSLLRVDGRALTSVVGAALREAGATEVLAVGGDLQSLASLPEIDRALEDEFPGEGPLGGIITALDAAANDFVVILACDTPRLDSATPKLLIEGLSTSPVNAVAYAVVEGRAQPLTAAWNRPVALPALRRAVLPAPPLSVAYTSVRRILPSAVRGSSSTSSTAPGA